MDRRKFLGTAGGGLFGMAALRGERLYGTPASVGPGYEIVPHLLKLHLREAGVADERLPYFGALAFLAADVVSNRSAAQTFTNDPRGYLATAGYGDIQVDTDSREFRIVLALADPAVREAAQADDPVRFLDALAAHGIDADVAGPGVRPPPSYVTIYMYVTALAGVVFAVAVVAAVIVTVAGEPLAVQESSVELASALGGKAFAQDVVKVAVRKRADAIIEGVRQGRIPLPADTTEEELVSRIEAILGRHLP